MFVHFLVVLYLNKDIMCNKKYFFFPSYLTRLCEINWLINWLIDRAFFTSRRKYFIYMEASLLSVKGCYIWAFFSALLALEQFFIVPHMLWHGTFLFAISSEGLHYCRRLSRTARGTEDLCWPGSTLEPWLRRLTWAEKLSSPEPLDQFQPNFAQSIPGWR